MTPEQKEKLYLAMSSPITENPGKFINWIDTKVITPIQEEMYRLKKRIEELEKPLSDCEHEHVDMKSIRCTICLDCGEILDVID